MTRIRLIITKICSLGLDEVTCMPGCPEKQRKLFPRTVCCSVDYKLYIAAVAQCGTAAHE